MKFFLKKIVVFNLIIASISICSILLPATPKASSSLLFASIDKDLLLEKIDSNRIIFIGGSNLSFGLNSQIFKDSLDLNPINTSIHAGIGINFMLDHHLSKIDSGDIVVLVPEYTQYFGNYADGEEALLRLVLDTKNTGIENLSFGQFKNTVQFFPKFVLSKYNPFEYLIEKSPTKPIYERNSFNSYGDAVAHWGQKPKPFSCENISKMELSESVFTNIVNFKNEIEKKNATLVISFPCYDIESFKINRKQIKKVWFELKKSKLLVLGTPNLFSFKKKFFFNSPYHLTEEGAEIRTLILEDLIKNKSELQHN
jgi:hypothetical protein